MGRYDKYALEVVRRFPEEQVLEHYGKTENHDKCTLFTMNNVKGDDFAKFALAVIWRASISSRPEFRKIALGPYESKARDVLFGKRPLAWLSNYSLLVGYYKNPEGDQFDWRGLLASPTRFRLDDLNGWQFSLCGFNFKAILDSRRLPDVILSAAANGKNHLCGSVTNYKGTSEYQALLNMAGAELRRQKARTDRRESSSISQKEPGVK